MGPRCGQNAFSYQPLPPPPARAHLGILWGPAHERKAKTLLLVQRTHAGKPRAGPSPPSIVLEIRVHGHDF